MGSMIIPIVIFIVVVAVLMLAFMGGDSAKKKQGPQVIGCPPGFNPGLAYMEKYGETGIAYDETQKLLCVLHQGTNQSRVVSPSDILAAAFLEDGVVLAKSVRTDEQGKALLSSLLTEESKAIFQDAPEESATTGDGTIKNTSQTIEQKILINDPANPVQTINFLNMEAKKGGLIYNEASAQAKNWQDLLGFLIRLAGKTSPQTQTQGAPQNQPVATPAEQPS
ncbi:MAG: hypothetical protein VST68_01285 [Nitrospirota bacterium]|nr:hypothetical protein [Nitrospirota bacterium]